MHHARLGTQWWGRYLYSVGLSSTGESYTKQIKQINQYQRVVMIGRSQERVMGWRAGRLLSKLRGSEKAALRRWQLS